MNTRPPLFKPAGPGSLADEPDFTLAHLSVRPSIREVSAGERRETLEPRMMQVLVVLAHADGAVVSRDELIRQCWGGRAVSDDAINRAISKLRQLGAFDGCQAFTIETIARVGYRLICSRTGQKPAFPAVAPPAAAPDASAIPGAAKNAKRVSWTTLSLLAAAFVVTAVAVVFGLSSFAPRPASTWTVAEAHQPFVSGPGLALYPALSPDGAMIAYVAGPDIAHMDLYVRLRSGGDPQRLTTGAVASAPAWSRDGSRIAYLSNPQDTVCKIMVIDALGGGTREAARCRPADRSTLAWYGDNLFYSDAATAELPSAIYRLALDSGAVSQRSHPAVGLDKGDTDPVVSPDGKTVAFLRQIHWDKTQVALLDLATGGERVLLDSFDDNVSVAWSDDSTTLFIARDTKWDAALWAYPISGASPQRITTSSLPFGHLSSGSNGLLAMELHNNEGDLAVAAATPAAPLSEFAKGYDIFFQGYAPDGTLAVLARQSGGMGLFLAGPDNVLHKLIALPSDAAAAITWSPDSSRLAFVDSDKAGLAIDVVDRSGLQKRTPFQATETGWLDWSDDGKSLLVAHLDKQGWRAWRVDPDRPDKPVLLPLRGWLNMRARGGMVFGVSASRNGIWRLDGPMPQKITDWPPIDEGDSWALSDDNLVYLDMSDRAHPLFKAVSIRGGPSRTIGYAQGVYGDDIFAVNPKTKRVTFQHRVMSESDIGLIRVVRK